MIYLDYSATTPLSLEVQDTINKVTREFIGNANSLNSLGQKSSELMKSATEQIAKIFLCDEKEITYTSGATESNNLALIGTCLANKKRGKHIIVSKLEHPSIYAICDYLKTLGFEISYVKNNEDGLVDFEDLKKLIKPSTILVSIVAVNSELGIRQPLKMIRQIIKKANPKTYFHSDMTQALGKVNISLKDVDMASMSIHKIYGPKGIGIFYKANNVKVSPLLYGSGKSNFLHPGTPALPLIVGSSKAIRLATEDLDRKYSYIEKLNKKLVNFFNELEGVTVNNTEYSIPNMLNISLLNIRPETFIHAMDEHEIYLSTTTACSSGDSSSSVMALYNDEKRASHTIRVSLSSLTTNDEINKFIEIFKEEYNKLNDLTNK
jgi:cysteine desulfurase